jgi:hypothetical protein
MKRTMMQIAFAAGAAMLAASCASTPPKPKTPAELLLGTWSCEGKIGGAATAKAQMTYAAGGTTTFHLTVNGGQAGMMIEGTGDGAGTWKLSDDSKQLEANVTSVKIASAKMNGAAVEPTMVQALATQMLVGKGTTAAMTITPSTLTLVTSDGGTTTCTR